MWALMLLGGTAEAAPEMLPPTAATMTELQRIEAASVRGSVDALRLKYQEAARARPGDVMPRIFVAWCSVPSEDAWNQLKAIAAIYPDNPWVRYGMGRIYTNWKGMSDMARVEFELVLKRDPRFFPALVGLGDLARLRDDLAGAEQHYQAALALAEDPFARSGLGLTLAASQKGGEAREELKKAIAAMPEQPQALMRLITLSMEAKDPESVNMAQLLADLRPKDAVARKMLADLRFEADDKQGAAREYERLVRLGNPELGILHRLAELYRALGDVEGEERALQTAAALDRTNPEPNLRIARLRLARKDFEGAEGQWLEALARDPKRAEAREALGQARLEKGVLHEALEEFRLALAIDPSMAATAALVQKLEADFKLPKKKARGSVNNIYWAVQSSLGKMFEERKAASPGLAGKLKLRVRISKEGRADGVDVLDDSLKDPHLLGHVYFGLKDAEFPKQKTEPVFEFELGPKKKSQ